MNIKQESENLEMELEPLMEKDRKVIGYMHVDGLIMAIHDSGASTFFMYTSKTTGDLVAASLTESVRRT